MIKTEKTVLMIFYLCLKKNYGCSVNKIALESRITKKRQTKVILPLKNNIIKLNEYIANLRKSSYQELQEKFTHQSWLNLAKRPLFLYRYLIAVEQVKLNKY